MDRKIFIFRKLTWEVVFPMISMVEGELDSLLLLLVESKSDTTTIFTILSQFVHVAICKW